MARTHTRGQMVVSISNTFPGIRITGSPTFMAIIAYLPCGIRPLRF